MGKFVERNNGTPSKLISNTK